MKFSMYTGVYALTLLISAALLFSIQPMFSKMILPLLGGTPQVWNTAMVFFQVTLLAGYAYAHATTRLLGIRLQAIVHILLLIAFASILPFLIPEGEVPPVDKDPTLWQLVVMATIIGVSVLCFIGKCAHVPEMVLRNRSPGFHQPLFLVRGKQSWLDDLSFGLSISDRALFPAKRTIRLLDVRLFSAYRYDGLVRSDDMGSWRQEKSKRSRTYRRKEHHLETQRLLGLNSLFALLPHARRHHVHHNRYRLGSAALDFAARNVCRNIYSRFLQKTHPEHRKNHIILCCCHGRYADLFYHRSLNQPDGACGHAFAGIFLCCNALSYNAGTSASKNLASYRILFAYVRRGRSGRNF